MGNENQLFMLLQGVQRIQDPRLHDLLRALIADISRLNNEIFPPAQPIDTIIPPATVVPDPTIFTYEFLKEGVQFTWNRSSFDTAYFELRRGTNWDTADRILVTPTTSAVIDPLPIGSTRFLLRGVGLTGELSLGTLTLDVLVPALGSVSAQANIIDNNVLLYWTEPTSVFRIDHYNLDRAGVLFGTTQGTFTTLFEQVSGTYLYGIVAVDIAGNQSPRTEVPATVSQPPDYILLDNQFDLLFDGTRVNVSLLPTPARLLASTYSETWRQHFANRSWNSIRDQVNAGYPIYAQPSKETGSYERVFDFGTILSNVLINLQLTYEVVAVNVNIVQKLATSTDNITYTSFVIGSSLFAASVRYVKVRLEFTATI